VQVVHKLIAWIRSWFRRPAPEPLPPGVIAREGTITFADGRKQVLRNVRIERISETAPTEPTPAPPQNRQYRRADMRRTKWTTARDDLRPMRRRHRRTHWRVSCQDAWRDLRLKELEAQWAKAEAAVAAGIASFLLESAGPARSFSTSASTTLRFNAVDPELLKVFTG
jgi:hypothetical protein